MPSSDLIEWYFNLFVHVISNSGLLVYSANFGWIKLRVVALTAYFEVNVWGHLYFDCVQLNHQFLLDVKPMWVEWCMSSYVFLIPRWILFFLWCTQLNERFWNRAVRSFILTTYATQVIIRVCRIKTTVLFIAILSASCLMFHRIRNTHRWLFFYLLSFDVISLGQCFFFTFWEVSESFCDWPRFLETLRFVTTLNFCSHRLFWNFNSLVV